ncbi:Wadjet anti-phage system protein JetD domain-containing protein [Agriterribacter sp.]|uniref:Wadjet anti-phage system protein JetD domain-containing protein n=1 Tax=Agriterribacter sp. TaxID=2821509 RepID=UPI002C6DF606|nr:Wadjet anti-phage system protein JetD domain-containing protein [Agriterribacter sp.]HTN08034.1 Wadjet anti-phage system protein JetD domain-containing protein [Agriterribacter sp.]
MISPEEIKKQALKWWRPLLQSTIYGDMFFPKSIDRIGKIQPGHITQQFETLQQEIATLYRHSKNQTGIGYLVKTAEKNFRRTGSHKLPDAIIFETVEDYVVFTGKKKEWRLFLLNYEKVIKSISRLKEWALLNCVWLTDAQINWDDILKVCHYFLNNPRSNLYLRQLPIAVRTKFIEDNVTLIQSLLDFLIPDHIRSHQQKRFAERYFLKYDEPLIRIRMLDTYLTCFGNFTDISIPLSDFEKLDLSVRNVLITENKMNFLTLPAMSSTIAVWSGGGFNVSYLRNVAWLKEKHIFYWGDIDEHGFQILHQLRSYYPKTQSVMMDCKTFEHFTEFSVVGTRNKSEQLSLLNEEEHKLFDQLKLTDKNRLEQEKISQGYVEEYLKSLGQ